jgi:hypothetical protein
MHAFKQLSQIVQVRTMQLRHLFAAFALALLPEAVNAEVLAVCGAPTGYSNVAISTALAQPETAVGTPLALWRDAKGYDLLLNWGENDQRSLRAEGADITGDELGIQLIHVVVIRAGSKSLEHFLFSFEDDSPGELIWNAPSDAPGASDELASYETTCIR